MKSKNVETLIQEREDLHDLLETSWNGFRSSVKRC